jgi:hypothetical protein
MADSGSKNYARLGVLIGALVLSSSLTLAQDYSAQHRNARTDSAYKKLLDAHLFNFGGVGFASQITPEEKAFRVLLESWNPVSAFKRLLSEANPEGQLYALYGLYLRDRDSFKKEAEKLKLAPDRPPRGRVFVPVEKGKVRTGRGCLLLYEDKRAVIEEIAKGEFDHAFRSNDTRLFY